MAGLRFCAVLALISVFLFSSASSAAADGPSTTSRRLLQSGCSVDYTTLDYSPVTSACQSPYPVDACCSAYSSFCAPHKAELNDFSKMCAVYFSAYLSMAGSYPNGVFLGRCNNGNNVCN